MDVNINANVWDCAKANVSSTHNQHQVSSGPNNNVVARKAIVVKREFTVKLKEL